MKASLLALILVLASATASAAEITLQQTPCTGTYFCYNVQSNTAAEIDYIDYSSHYERLTSSLDGVLYDSGLWAVRSLVNVPLYSPEGAVIYVTVAFSEVRKPCVRSGRATICPVVVTLTGGTIQQ